MWTAEGLEQEETGTRVMGAKSCLLFERQSPMTLKAKRREWSCLCLLSTRFVIISENTRVGQRPLRGT